MSGDFFSQAFVYLVAAVISVPIAKRLGLGSVLGYLIAGAIIGPSALDLVGEHEDVLHFAEFGVVMMLFIIGLELRPSLLWRLRGPILGLGGAQVVATAFAIACISLRSGRPFPEAITIGLILAMSSTAIVLQSLAERGVLKTSGGQACFSVLLFQDIAVIPIIALLPLLAYRWHDAPDAAQTGALAALPEWLRPIVTLGAVASVIIGGRLVLPRAFRYLAKTKLREVGTAGALLLVVATALLMELVGLSAALGAFVAGVVLADSEYRHQLEADLEPFKGLLLGLFFIAVGAGIDFPLIAAQPARIAAITGGLIVVKLLVLLGLSRAFRHEWSASWLFAFALAQGGEFCFVLLAMARDRGVLAESVTNPLTAAVALSMALTPLLLVVNEKLVQPLFARCGKTEREPDEIDEHDNPVILAGFGRFGHIVGRLLRANGFGVTVLDNDPDQVELLGRFGMKAFYGDASRADLLTAAGAERAKLFLCAIDNEEKALEIVELVQREFPHLKIIARAESRQHAYELMKRGLDHVHRVTLASALDFSIDALRALGVRAHQAHRAARIFKDYDEDAMRELLKYWDDDKTYVSIARQHIENLENVLRDDKRRFAATPDDGWEIGVPKNEV